MAERILLAVDESKHARKAADVVQQLAKDAGAEVTVVHVHEIAAGQWGRFRVDDMTGDDFARTVMHELTEAGIAGHLASRETYIGEVAQAIVATSDEMEADVIAVGSRGRSDLGSFALGSVSHKLLHLSHRPVLVVPAA